MLRWPNREDPWFGQRLHTTDSQLVREGVIVTFHQLLAECVFAGNALVSHSGATPYHARFGTTPAVLPDPWQIPDDAGGGRDVQRVREVALQKIVESTANARIGRALRGVTSTPGEALDYRENDLVEFYRPPNTKDVPGWMGPAQIRESPPARGQATVL